MDSPEIKKLAKKTDLSENPPIITASQYEGEGKNISAEETNSKSKKPMTGIAIFAFTQQGIENELRIENASDPDSQNCIDTTCLSQKITSELTNRLVSVINEVLSSICEENIEKKENFEYRVWYKDSEPTGEPITTEKKEGIMANKKAEYDLLILREESITHVFINEEKAKPPPGKLAYRILIYALKHKGAAGTAWNIAKNVWDVKEVEQFKDLNEMAKALELQPRRKQGKMEELAGQTKGEVKRFSRLISRRIVDLNQKFLINLETKLDTNDMDEYELTPLITYCLIETN